VNAGVAAQVKEFNELVRAEKGPQKEPVCKHKFNPMDNRCDYCHEALETVAAKEFGSTFVGGAQRRANDPNYGVSFAKQKLEQGQARKEKDRKKRHIDYLLGAVMLIAFLLGLLHTVLQQMGYIPS